MPRRATREEARLKEVEPGLLTACPRCAYHRRAGGGAGRSPRGAAEARTGSSAGGSPPRPCGSVRLCLSAGLTCPCRPGATCSWWTGSTFVPFQLREEPTTTSNLVRDTTPRDSRKLVTSSIASPRRTPADGGPGTSTRLHRTNGLVPKLYWSNTSVLTITATRREGNPSPTAYFLQLSGARRMPYRLRATHRSRDHPRLVPYTRKPRASRARLYHPSVPNISTIQHDSQQFHA